MQKVPYSQARNLINEADILLFRAQGFVGKGIVAYTGGIHSHVGIAHWDDDRLYCVEQREFKGGRSVILSSQIKDSTIDIYRASPIITKISSINNDSVDWNLQRFNDQTARKITSTALSLTGQPYGWRNIWEIFKGYAPGFRLIYRPKNGDDTISQAYVCSTVVTYSYRINYADPCPNLSDARTTPADIAQSSMFHYLFTIEQD